LRGIGRVTNGTSGQWGSEFIVVSIPLRGIGRVTLSVVAGLLVAGVACFHPLAGNWSCNSLIQNISALLILYRFHPLAGNWSCNDACRVRKVKG
jgi:hypothetical protein